MDVSRLFIYALFIFGVLLPGSVIAQTDMLRLSITDRAQIEGMLANELENKLLSTAKFEGQSGQVNVHVKLAPSSGTVVVNLSREFVPYNTHYMTAEMEDSTSELANIVSELLRDIIKINGISFQIDGVNVDELFQEPTKNMLEGKNSYAAPAGSKSIVVSAGHGIYYHYGYNDWRAQRDPSNGIIEDFITPGYAAELGGLLTQRSGAQVHSPRSSSTMAHAPSGEPWWKIGARYHLQATYPLNRRVWWSFPKSTSPLRERDDDIASRPNFANHIGANTLISIHTNAAESAAATGTRVIYHTGRIADQQLASNILCYMKENIQAQDAYANYLVPNAPQARNDLGENRRAMVPAVIVEVGFHTNVSDALALQDPVFRKAAMRGVEKGHRLDAEGETICQPLELTSIPDVGGPNNSTFPLAFYYKGHPQFPVQARIELVSCPPGFTCTPGTVSYDTKEASPLYATFACNSPIGNPPTTSRWRTMLTDEDKVSTTSVEFNVTCGVAGNGQSLSSATRHGTRNVAASMTED